MILPIISLLLLQLHSALAQTTSATCLPGFDWTLNDESQSPCLVAAFLGYQCAPNNGTFNVGPLTSGQQYLPPSGDQVNACECSSVYFSLLSACALCQGSSLGTFTSWTQSCPQDAVSVETYPMATPNGTHIPSWAYLPLTNGAFDVAAAGRNATGDASFGKNTNSLSTGAIVGLAIGSTVALLLILIALWIFCRTRNVEHRAQLLASRGSESGDGSGVRYDKIEGPPRRPFHFLPHATPKVVSYRAGLNFDLNKARRGDLVELSDAHKGSRNQQISRDSQPSSAFASRTSLESNTKFAKKRDPHRATHESIASPHLPKLFSRAKEVKARGDARLDLADEGASSPSDNSPQYRDSSPGREGRPPVLDM